MGYDANAANIALLKGYISMARPTMMVLGSTHVSAVSSQEL